MTPSEGFLISDTEIAESYSDDSKAEVYSVDGQEIVYSPVLGTAMTRDDTGELICTEASNPEDAIFRLAGAGSIDPPFQLDDQIEPGTHT